MALSLHVPDASCAVRLAGIGQLALVSIGLLLPRILGWPAEFRRLSLLTRQSCWAHFIYLLAGNATLAFVAIIAPDSLLGGDALAIAASLFAATYAASRLPLQFFVYDRGLTHVDPWYKLGEAALLFVYMVMAAGYGFAAWVNLKGSIDLA
jgi:hypothetical protein